MLPEITLINVGGWQSPDSGMSSHPRFITKYELEFYPVEGAETFIDGESFRIIPGMVLFSRPGQIRFSRFPFTTTFIYFDIAPNETRLDELIARIPTISQVEGIGKLFELMEEYYESAPLRAEALLIELLYRLGTDAPAIMTNSTRRGQAELYHAIEFMKSNLSRQLTLSEMASASGYSVSRFSQIFGEFIGTTPQEYFRSLRLSEAKRRLIAGKGTSEVANELGFQTVSHFCSAFRREFGMTPGQFVKDKKYTDYEN